MFKTISSHDNDEMLIKRRSGKSPTTQAELKRKVIYFAICSRVFILLVSFISNKLLPDHEAGVFMVPLPLQNETTTDRVIQAFLGGLSRWDGQYFLHISHHGYTHENTLAFFPFFPYSTGGLAQIIVFTTGSLMNISSANLISAVTINFGFFVGAAVKLFDLSCIIFQDDKLAYIAALFFCINPASIFFTALYSESCFSFFTFSGMLFYINSKSILSSFAFGLSVCVRSNGIINIGFLTHESLKHILKLIKSKTGIYGVIRGTYIELHKFLIYFIFIFAPFVIFQNYMYLMYCVKKPSIPPFLKDFGIKNSLVMPDGTSPLWCNYTIPISYSFIQSHYWNVGFLKYYELKQIPNFLLALPIICLILSNSYLFMMENKLYLRSLGLGNINYTTFGGRRMRPETFVFVVHVLFLTVFSILFAHVQVSTRMIASSSPVLYWFVALTYSSTTGDDFIQSRLTSIQTPRKYSLIEPQTNVNSFWKTVIITEKPADLRSNLLRLYFVLYATVGTILFSNFYPWT